MSIALRDLAQTTQTLPAAARPGAIKAAWAAAQTLWGQWRARAIQRMLLAQMSDREVRDLGLTPSDVMMEINKPFWRG